MLINNYEVDFKFTRPADIERYEQAILKMSKDEEKADKAYKAGKMRMSEWFAAKLELIKGFFVEAVGTDCLDGIDDMDEALEIFLGFCDEAASQTKAMEAKATAFKQKLYSRDQIDSEV